MLMLKTIFRRAKTLFWTAFSIVVILLAVGFGRNLEDGSVVRLGLDYDLRDALSVGGGILLYQAGDLPPLSAFGRNDRLYLQAKYSF